MKPQAPRANPGPGLKPHRSNITLILAVPGAYFGLSGVLFGLLVGLF